MLHETIFRILVPFLKAEIFRFFMLQLATNTLYLVLHSLASFHFFLFSVYLFETEIEWNHGMMNNFLFLYFSFVCLIACYQFIYFIPFLSLYFILFSQMSHENGKTGFLNSGSSNVLAKIGSRLVEHLILW